MRESPLRRGASSSPALLARSAGSGCSRFPPQALAANDAQTILNIAATAEVLATIVNTEGAQKVHFSSQVTKRNVLDAAYQELDHYNVLTNALGAKPATKKIWIPDALFANEHNLLSGLVFGDGVFVNAYQIGVTAFGNAGKGTIARYAAEIMGIESVHRALALQSLGKPGNDQAFASGSTPYFTDITNAVSLLQGAGFGFGAKGKGPASSTTSTGSRSTPSTAGSAPALPALTTAPLSATN